MIAALAVTALATIVAGQTPFRREGPLWRWWSNPAIAGEIGLTPRQVEAIESAQANSRAARADIGRRLREERARLGELVAGRELDRAEIARVLGTISRLQRDQLRSVVHLRVRVRRILTPEQLSRLLARYPMLMQRPWEGPREGPAGLGP